MNKRIRAIFYKFILAFLVLNESACLADNGKGFGGKVKLENFTESSCPAVDFPGFFALFSENESVQKKYTNSMVVSMSIEVDGVSEPTPFIETIPKSRISFPLMPKSGERKSRQLHFHFPDSSAGSVVLASDNSGYRVRYIFIQASCWYLIGIENMSI